MSAKSAFDHILDLADGELDSYVDIDGERIPVFIPGHLKNIEDDLNLVISDETCNVLDMALQCRDLAREAIAMAVDQHFDVARMKHKMELAQLAEAEAKATVVEYEADKRSATAMRRLLAEIYEWELDESMLPDDLTVALHDFLNPGVE